MSTPTKEQVQKLASDIRQAKQKGFIAHLASQGIKEATISKLHSLYVDQDKVREEKLEGLRSIILGTA